MKMSKNIENIASNVVQSAESAVEIFNKEPTDDLLQNIFSKIQQRIDRLSSWEKDKKCETAEQILSHIEHPQMVLNAIKSVDDEDLKKYLLLGLSANKDVSQETATEIYNIVTHQNKEDHANDSALKDNEDKKDDWDDWDEDEDDNDYGDENNDKKDEITTRICKNLLLNKNLNDTQYAQILYNFHDFNDNVDQLWQVVKERPTIPGASDLLYYIKQTNDWNEQYRLISNAANIVINIQNPKQSEINGFIETVKNTYLDRGNTKLINAAIKAKPTKTTFKKAIAATQYLNSDDTSEIFECILEHDHSPQMITKILSEIKKFEPFEQSENMNGFSWALKKILDYDTSKPTQKLVLKIAKEKKLDIYGHKSFVQPQMLDLLEKVNTAVKSNDETILKKLKKLGDKQVYRIDHEAMNFLVNNFTEENLQKVNNLRALWGLKCVVSEESLTEKNLRDIRRMEFSQTVSETKVDNPHYSHTYSQAYQNFIPDYNVDYISEDYKDVLKESNAVSLLNEHGFSSFTKQLPEVLAEQHVPPQLVQQLCIKDLQHLLIEYHADDINNRDRREIFNLSEVGIRHEADSVRETFWQEVVKDKKLIEFMSKDLKKKGIPTGEINQLWENAERYGYPNAYDHDRDKKVTSVFLQVHHRKALKDGGTNTPDNFIIVVNMSGKLNSHDPLHEWDNPLVHLYKHENAQADGVIISQKKTGKDDVEVRLNTVFIADEENMKNKNSERVLYYGGIDSSAMYVGDVNRSVRSAINKISKVYDKLAEKYQKQQPTSQTEKTVLNSQNPQEISKPQHSLRRTREVYGE